MTETPNPSGRTPAWLWLVFGVGLAIFGAGAFLARIDGHLWGIPILAVGLAIVVTFVVLRGRYTGKP